MLPWTWIGIEPKLSAHMQLKSCSMALALHQLWQLRRSVINSNPCRYKMILGNKAKIDCPILADMLAPSRSSGCD